MSARDPLQELEDALSFPTSPDFSARVRQRVSVEPVRSRMWFGRGLAVAAAAAVVVALAGGFGVISTLRNPDVRVAQVSRPAAATPSTIESEQPTVTAIEPVRAFQRSASAPARESVRSFETVVPDDQLRALDRLLGAMREGRATVPPATVDVELNDRGERVLKALVIEPVTVELLAGTPAEPSKNPVRDPNK